MIRELKNTAQITLSRFVYLNCELKKIGNRAFRVELNKNATYKNIHFGERCFILGNGPSLKGADLASLKHETVFCVNQCMRNPEILKINPKYYLCIDNNLFNIDTNRDEDKELLNTYKALGDIPGLKCFFPIGKKSSFVEKYSLDEILDVSYIFPAFKLPEGYRDQFKLTSAIPFFGTVVQEAIVIAIYMGFSNIYLLGCDETGIVVTINSILKKENEDFYSYSVTQNEKKRMETMVENSGLEHYCASYLYMVQAFRYLNTYCTNHNIELVNCSGNTVIDSVKREHLEDVIDDVKD